jgi:ABC-type lipoprotein export system ATPase subunit
MTLEFNNVIPFPLQEYPHGSESVWKSEFKIDFPQKIVLNASSGKGKSTFVNTVYGIRQDFEGTIKIDNQNISDFTLDDWIELRRTKLSIVFQDLQLFPELTVIQNLQLKNQLTNHREELRIIEMLELLGIGDKQNKLCKNLSLGQQQRVAIIRSLLQPFELLLMDEPFSHLDDVNAKIALDLISSETDLNNGGFLLTTLGGYHGFSYERELNL